MRKKQKQYICEYKLKHGGIYSRWINSKGNIISKTFFGLDVFDFLSIEIGDIWYTVGYKFEVYKIIKQTNSHLIIEFKQSKIIV